MTIKQIEKWLKKYDIENYHINDDLTVNVDNDVYLLYKNLTEIPFQFGKINGHFNCAYNQLISLEGCPKEIKGNFICSNNQLISLEGCPEIINGDFICYGNKLTSLNGCPKEVKKDFYCFYNQLTSLEGCPEIINGDFECDDNLKDSIEYKRYLIRYKLQKIS